MPNERIKQHLREYTNQISQSQTLDTTLVIFQKMKGED
jgi:hypothetical protein